MPKKNFIAIVSESSEYVAKLEMDDERVSYTTKEKRCNEIEIAQPYQSERYILRFFEPKDRVDIYEIHLTKEDLKGIRTLINAHLDAGE